MSNCGQRVETLSRPLFDIYHGPGTNEQPLPLTLRLDEGPIIAPLGRCQGRGTVQSSCRELNGLERPGLDLSLRCGLPSLHRGNGLIPVPILPSHPGTTTGHLAVVVACACGGEIRLEHVAIVLSFKAKSTSLSWPLLFLGYILVFVPPSCGPNAVSSSEMI